MNMSKSRDIQAKMPSPKVIYASNESKSVLARNREECRDNDKNSQSVFLSFKCILARNCEGTEQLRKKILDEKRELGICLNVKISQNVIKIVVDFWEKGTIIIGMEA